jgi:hypothetical protein
MWRRYMNTWRALLTGDAEEQNASVPQLVVFSGRICKSSILMLLCSPVTTRPVEAVRNLRGDGHKTRYSLTRPEKNRPTPKKIIEKQLVRD